MTTIINPGGDGPENIERAASLLRASKQNLEVFRAMYTGNKQWKSLEEIRDKITTFNTNTDKAARRLHGENILDRKVEGRTVVYGKKQFYSHNRDKILTLSRNKARLKSFPTKRRPAANAPQTNFKFKTRLKVRQIYVDDIDTFKAVKKVRKGDASVLKGMPERTINRALCTILNQAKKRTGAESDMTFIPTS